MKKIFKILSIFVMVFVLFSCANPSSDSTSGSQPSGSKTPVETPTDDTEPSGPETPVETPSDDTEPSGPETPVETPSDDPVEETPEEPTYSITFIAYTEKEDTATEAVRTFLNSLPDYKNLKEGEEVKLPTKVYLTEDGKLTLNKTDEYLDIIYEDTITSVVVGNKSIMIKFRI